MAGCTFDPGKGVGGAGADSGVANGGGGSDGGSGGGGLSDLAVAADFAQSGGNGGGADLSTGGGLPLDLSAPPDLTDPGSTGAGDGTPTRQQCTNNFGQSLTTTHGRLDGYLVSIVPSTANGCNADRDHLHLQVLVQGAVYDVAVNVHDNQGGNVFYLAKDLKMPDGAWSEGWHTGATSSALSYPNLGVSASDFTAIPEAALETAVENELATANHISIFGTGYNTNDGMHLIHYKGPGIDGAVVVNPLAATSRLLLFHFANQSF
jgi:hypothetical protein